MSEVQVGILGSGETTDTEGGSEMRSELNESRDIRLGTLAHAVSLALLRKTPCGICGYDRARSERGTCSFCGHTPRTKEDARIIEQAVRHAALSA